MRACKVKVCEQPPTWHGLCARHAQASPDHVALLRSMWEEGTLYQLHIVPLLDRWLGKVRSFECYCGERVNLNGVHRETSSVWCYPVEADVFDRGRAVILDVMKQRWQRPGRDPRTPSSSRSSMLPVP